MTRPSLRIAVIAPLRYPIAEPHAGGLESSIWHLVRGLRLRGHRVTLCAVAGSDYLSGGPSEFVLPPVFWPDAADSSDVDYPPGYLDRAFPALDAALGFIAEHAGEFDIVVNHCLHGLPLSWAGRLGVPMVTTLHTPVLTDLLVARERNVGAGSAFLSVSEYTASEWRRQGVDSVLLPNAVDTAAWPLGAGGSGLVWFGRIVPEKGAHLAIAAARLAGLPLTLAGRVGDATYAAREILPRLGGDIRYVGALRQPELAELVGASACALVTPVWEEPFGLVIAEAMACGTPVVSFDTGGIPEVVGTSPGARLVPTGDVAAMARAATAIVEANSAVLRQQVRDDAERRFSLGARLTELEGIYGTLIARFGAGERVTP